MKKLLVGFISAFLTGHSLAEEVTATMGFTTDYRSLGASQTAGEPAIQGSLDVAFDNGVYAGLWGSNVNYGDDANLELDYYLGYSGAVNDSLSYAADIAYFQSPGYSYDGNYFYYEFYGYYDALSLSYTYADSYFNSGKSSHLVTVDYAIPLPKELSLNLHAGRNMGDYWDEDSGLGEYNDYSVGVSGAFHGLDIAVDYVMNDSDFHYDEGVSRNDNHFVLTVSRTM